MQFLENDLTLDSVFARQHDRALLFINAINYKFHYGEKDVKEEFFSSLKVTKKKAFIPLLTGPLKILTQQELDFQQQEESAKCFRKLFGHWPDWYAKQYPYRHDYHEGNNCDRCGTFLHFLNRHYNLCKDCNEWLQTTAMEEMQKQLLGSLATVTEAITQQTINESRIGWEPSPNRQFHASGDDIDIPDEIPELEQAVNDPLAIAESLFYASEGQEAVQFTPGYVVNFENQIRFTTDPWVWAAAQE